MGNTTQHGWPTPEEGQSNYEDTFAEFFEQIDDVVEIRGVDSDTSNHSAVAGAKYFATNTEKLYIGDGSSWKLFDLRTTIRNTQRGDPTTSELSSGENMTYNSDGSGTGSAGDFVYAVNDAGTIKTTIRSQKSNAT